MKNLLHCAEINLKIYPYANRITYTTPALSILQPHLNKTSI